jgi:L-lactate dehydrogenase complex protein LldG
MWRSMPERFPNGMPSQVVVITGPSKTSDIEKVLTTGVHGPRRLWICLLDT